MASALSSVSALLTLDPGYIHRHTNKVRTTPLGLSPLGALALALAPSPSPRPSPLALAPAL